MNDLTILRSYDLTVLQSYGLFDRHVFPDDLLANLNTVSGGDGFFLYVPANAKPSQPVCIDNLFQGRKDTSLPSRNVVIMEAGSAAELLLDDCIRPEEVRTCNDLTVIALGEGATLNMVRLQKANSTIRLHTVISVWQATSSRMKTHYVSLSEGNIRNSINVQLSGKKSEHIVSGLSMTQQTGHVDNDVRIEHISPDCQSNQLFKYILSDTSTGLFTGRIVVNKDAQKTAAYQRSSNILLHLKAKMSIRPQLEIYADDVKCSHGATVGQLDAEALFYLRSRGISEKEAKKMLLQAFAGEVINGISCETVRKSVLQKLKMN